MLHSRFDLTLCWHTTTKRKMLQKHIKTQKMFTTWSSHVVEHHSNMFGANTHDGWCRTPTLAKCGGEAQHLEKLGFGVLWDSRMFRARQQGAKHLTLVLLVSLKRKYQKCPRIGNSDICNPSYGQKKGRESNWQFDSRPLKVRNRPLPNVWCPIWECNMEFERSRWGLQLWFIPRRDPILQSGVMAVQSSESPAGTNSGLHFGSPGNLCHLDAPSVASCREYYRE
jgi:hypothetical protein